jgi:hypothetical protein
MAQEVAQRALDECEYEGKTIREWIEIIKAQPAHGTDCISRQAAIEAAIEAADEWDGGYNVEREKLIESYISKLPSAQPETAKRIVGKSRGGMTLWYQCDMCNEPVDAQDNYCRGCGRRLIDE